MKFSKINCIKQLLIACLVLSVSLAGYGQAPLPLDSLIVRIPALMRSDEAEARKLIDELASRSEKENHPHGIVQSHFFRAWLSYRHDPADLAIQKIDSALNFIPHIGEDSSLIDFYILKGQAYVKKKQFGPALDLFKKALKIAEEQNDLQSKTGVMVSIGWAYMEDGKPGEAIYFFEQVLDLNPGENFANRALILSNIAACYNSTENFKLAEEFAVDAISTARKTKNNFDLANGLNILARSLYQQGKIKTAINHMEEAAVVREKVADPSMLASDYLQLADMHKRNHQYTLALQWAKKAESISISNTNTLKTDAAYKALSTIYEKLGDYKNSTIYLNKLLELKDSLNANHYNEAMAEMQVQFETQRKTAENLKLKQENLESRIQNINQQRWLLGLVAGVVLVIGSGIYIFLIMKSRYRTRLALEQLKEHKKRTLAVMEAEEKERRRIAADLHDGVGQILATASIQMNKTKKGQSVIDEMEALINQASSEIRAISHQVTPELLLNYGLTKTLEHEVSRLNSATDDTRFELYIHQENSLPDDMISLTIYRCFQELSSNIIKHAAASMVIINLSIQENEIELMIEDDGKGFEPDSVKNGLGMKNMKSRIAIFEGSLSIDSSPGNGTTTVIAIPTAAIAVKTKIFE